MNRQELVSAVITAQKKQGLKLEKNQVEKVVASTLETIRDTVKNGGEVKLLGFGNFSKQRKEAYVARNPSTGAKVDVPAKDVPKFKPSKNFLD